MSVARRREWIDPAHHCLSIAAQCRLLSISRSSYYYAPVPETEETLVLMRVIDATFLDMPWYGSRQMARHLRRAGHDFRAALEVAVLHLGAVQRFRRFLVQPVDEIGRAHV